MKDKHVTPEALAELIIKTLSPAEKWGGPIRPVDLRRCVEEIRLCWLELKGMEKSLKKLDELTEDLPDPPEDQSNWGK